ncbi:MAG: hypothetical protein ACN4G0_14755 [Polyangiales bacterium]
MVDSMGICEKHELPLDRNGECELCRLSLVPSKSPPARSAWWALIIPLLILGGVLLWALSSFGPAPAAAPQRGVPTPAPRPAPPVPEPEATPIEPAQAPFEETIPAEDIPLPDSAEQPAP